MSSDSPFDPSTNLEQAQFIKHLAEFGNAVAHPPASDTQLLAILLGFEACLSWINQQPEERVRSSVESASMPLISDQFLRHADQYLQIQVLCCITRIAKITAPRWPYEGKMMKEFFLVLVQSLGKLSSMHVITYAKTIQLLYTIARIRLCCVMAELEMEGSIIEMFGHFVTSIQTRPSDDVFRDMVTIMTRTIEAYFVDGNGPNQVVLLPVPVDLLNVLLTSVKKDKKEVSPASWALGKQILQELQQECSEKVLLRLAEAVRSLVNNVNDYAEIVTLICQKGVQVENMVSRMTFGEKLVGCKIMVWWPLLQKYFEGSVSSFNRKTKKHKILYDDGKRETLNLMVVDWRLVNDPMLLDGTDTRVSFC